MIFLLESGFLSPKTITHVFTEFDWFKIVAEKIIYMESLPLKQNWDGDDVFLMSLQSRFVDFMCFIVLEENFCSKMRFLKHPQLWRKACDHPVLRNDCHNYIGDSDCYLMFYSWECGHKEYIGTYIFLDERNFLHGQKPKRNQYSTFKKKTVDLFFFLTVLCFWELGILFNLFNIQDE